VTAEETTLHDNVAFLFPAYRAIGEKEPNEVNR
jgi:hypothetical protein